VDLRNDFLKSANRSKSKKIRSRPTGFDFSISKIMKIFYDDHHSSVLCSLAMQLNKHAEVA